MSPETDLREPERDGAAAETGSVRPWRSRLLRWLFFGILAAVVLLLLAHTPPVRSLVLRIVAGQLRASGIDLRAERLGYNLFNLTIDASNVRVAAVETPNAPFLEASRIRADLPWSILFGPLSVESLEIIEPRALARRGPNGKLNLPEAAEPEEPQPDEAPPNVAIDRLLVRDLDAWYVDELAAIDVRWNGVTLDLTSREGSAQGRLTTAGGLKIRAGDQSTTIQRLESGLAFDGSTLAIRDLVVEAPEGTIGLRGSIDLLTADPRLDLAFDGRIDLPEAASWASVEPAPAGTVAFEGRAEGPLADPKGTIEVSGDELEWRDLQEVSLRVGASLGASGVTVDPLTVRGIGGEIDGSMRVGFTESAVAGNARLQWRGLDLDRLLTVAAGEAPIALASQLDGRLNAAWDGVAVDAADVTIETTARPIRAARGLPLAGDVRLVSQRGAWSLDHDLRAGSIRLAGSGRGQLNARDLEATTVAGGSALTIADLGSSLRMLRAAGLDVPPDLPDAVGGRLQSNVELGGTLGAIRLDGALDVEDLQYRGTGPGRLTARVSADDTRASLETVDCRLDENRVKGDGSLRLADGALDGHFTADLRDLAALTADVPATWRPEGSLSVEGQLGGTPSAPRVTGTLEGGPLTIAGQPIDSVSAKVNLVDTALALQDVRIVQRSGSLSLDARYDTSSGAYDLTALGKGLAIRPVPGSSALPPAEDQVSTSTADAAIPLRARFDLRFDGKGTVSDPAGRGYLDVEALAWGDYAIGRSRVELEIASGRANVDAGLPDLSTTLRGFVALNEPRRFETTVRMDGTELSKLTALARTGEEGPVEGSVLAGAVTLAVDASGHLDRLQDAEVDLRLRLIDAAVDGLSFQLARPASLRYSGQQLVADDVELRFGQSTLVLQGAFGRQDGSGLRAALDGRVADIAHLARAAAAPRTAIDGEGSLRATVEASGTTSRPTLAADVRLIGATVSSGELPPISDLTLDAEYRSGLLRLERLAGTWQQASLSARGELPVALLGPWLPADVMQAIPRVPGPAKLEARLDSVTTETLAPFVDRETLANLDVQVAGTLVVDAASLDPSSVRARLELGTADFAITGVPLRQERPTRIALSDGRLQVEEFTWGGEGNRLVLDGGADLAGGGVALDLDLDGSLNLRMLSAFVPDLATAGTARLQVAATGSTSDPSLDGQVTFEDVEIRLRDPRLAISNLVGRVKLSEDELTVDDITASANGGTLRLSGTVGYPGFELVAGSLSIAGQGLAMEVLEGLQTEADLDLALVLSPDAPPEVQGKVTVLRGAYREAISLANLALGGEPGGGVETAGLEEPSAADRITLDVALVTAQDLYVDNNYGRLDLGANLRLVGTLGQPSIVGRSTIREGGEVFLGTNTYFIEQGTVDFTNPTRIEPDLNLRARTRISGYDITLSVSGTPDTLENTLVSEPPLSESDIVSLLVTGRALSEAGSAQTEVARHQMLAYLSGDLLGVAGRRVGLDTVRLERGVSRDALPTDLALFAGDADPSSRLTISKNISRDVEIVLSQNLREGGGLTWIAMYRPLANIELRTISRDDNSRAYEFRHTVHFGGGVRRMRERDSGPEKPRVVIVRFSGTPGVPEAELRDRLNLKSGDRFDFFKWQRDRDRLQRFYHDREYLEAEVRAAREPEAGEAVEEGVALAYAIERGPRASIHVDGYRLPGGLLDDMRETWTRAVFDGFLLDDFRGTTRRHLAGEGYLKPSIELEIITSPEGAERRAEEKVIAIRIEPGPRTPDRTINFEGAQGLAVDELQEFLEDRDLALTAWLEPESVEEQLERLYRSEGYLVAEVEIGEPVFQDRQATLPVRLEEGRPFTISQVRIDGRTTRPQTEVREAFGLEMGDPYRAADAETGRREVESGYRRRGFNDVRVGVEATADRDAGQVEITLSIAEGPQQVLRDVLVAGNETTEREVVSRTLDLETGEPANLAEWYRARKRLYDTGVFRSADITLEPLAEPAAQETTQPVRAQVTLEEWPRYRFRYGFQLNDEITPLAEEGRSVSPGIVADLQDRNLFGRAATVGIASRLQRDFRIVRPFLSVPRFFGLPLTSRVFLTRARQDFNAEGISPFVEDTTGISVEQRPAVPEPLEIAYSYRLERRHTFDSDPDPFDPIPFDVRVRVARLTGSVVADTRDNPFDARRGWFHSSTIESSLESHGSELRFVKYLVQAYYFRPFSADDRVVWASAVRLGLARGFGQDLISSERFFSGGASSVRGYPEDSLGDVDFLGDPRGGSALLVLNQELRFPVFKWVRGVGFADAGNVFTRVGDLSIADLRVALGFGARIQTPFALVRVDFAVPVSRRVGDPSSRWYFSIGQAF